MTTIYHCYCFYNFYKKAVDKCRFCDYNIYSKNVRCTMNYISVKDISKIWGITPRQTQRLLSAGRVSSAEKIGKHWLIPANAEKPVDYRRRNSKMPKQEFFTLPFKCPYIIMSTIYSVPGSADAVKDSLSYDKQAQLLFSSCIAYLRGNIDLAYKFACEIECGYKSNDLTIAVESLKCLCALYFGDVNLWQTSKKTVSEINCKTDEDRDFRDFQMGNIDMFLYDKSSVPQWLSDGEFSKLPIDCYAMARHSYLKYHMLDKGFEQVYLACAPLIAQSHAEGALVSEIYCRLALATALYELGDCNKAENQLDVAISLCLPDRIFAPLAESRNDLGRLLDKRLYCVSAVALNEVRSLSERVMSGWAELNKTTRGITYNLSLTPSQHYIAKLAAKGMSNAEISEQMGISINTVKRHLSEAMGKCGVTDRNRLSQFIGIK